ncbi:MAG: VOC family protein [Gemmatimonadota bacterium]
MQITPYLNFAGQCREAFEFYRDVLGGTITGILTYGESPVADEIPPESHDGVMHAQLIAGDAVLMGADGPPAGDGPMRNMSVALIVDEAAEAERIFAALAEGGQTTMPMEQTFWAERFGMCIDRFGTPWIVNGHMTDGQ